MPVVMFCVVKGNVSESTMADAFGSRKDVELSAKKTGSLKFHFGRICIDHRSSFDKGG
jgi:hypothetical protein